MLAFTVLLLLILTPAAIWLLFVLVELPVWVMLPLDNVLVLL